MDEVRSELQKIKNAKSAELLGRFFKTYDSGYGQGDKFYGITVPVQRSIAKKHKDLPLPEVIKLLKSPMHEERLIALFILVNQFKKGSEATKTKIYKFYLNNTKYVNNWDLVDSSAHKILGEYLFRIRHSGEQEATPESGSWASQDDVLVKLAKSKDLWEKRIAMIATYQFLQNGKSEETYKIAEILLHDNHDLIHKAVGWMLREAGKKVSEKELVTFLAKHYKTMPRTALRYSIEKFPQDIRQQYLQGEI